MQLFAGRANKHSRAKLIPVNFPFTFCCVRHTCGRPSLPAQRRNMSSVWFLLCASRADLTAHSALTHSLYYHYNLSNTIKVRALKWCRADASRAWTGPSGSCWRLRFAYLQSHWHMCRRHCGSRSLKHFDGRKWCHRDCGVSVYKNRHTQVRHSQTDILIKSRPVYLTWKKQMVSVKCPNVLLAWIYICINSVYPQDNWNIRGN